MAETVTPYLDRAEFEGMFRPLAVPERNLADLLLKAAAMLINRRVADAGRPPLAQPPTADPMAVLVSFEVVRDAMPAVPEMAGRIQYSIQTDNRLESGTLAAAAGLLDIDERQWQLLGLSATAPPAYGGMDGDFGHDTAAVGSPTGGGLQSVWVGDFP